MGGLDSDERQVEYSERVLRVAATTFSTFQPLYHQNLRMRAILCDGLTQFSMTVELAQTQCRLRLGRIQSWL